MCCVITNLRYSRTPAVSLEGNLGCVHKVELGHAAPYGGDQLFQEALMKLLPGCWWRHLLSPVERRYTAHRESQRDTEKTGVRCCCCTNCSTVRRKFVQLTYIGFNFILFYFIFNIPSFVNCPHQSCLVRSALSYTLQRQFCLFFPLQCFHPNNNNNNKNIFWKWLKERKYIKKNLYTMSFFTFCKQQSDAKWRRDKTTVPSRTR